MIGPVLNLHRILNTYTFCEQLLFECGLQSRSKWSIALPFNCVVAKQIQNQGKINKESKHIGCYWVVLIFDEHPRECLRMLFILIQMKVCLYIMENCIIVAAEDLETQKSNSGTN